MWFLFHIYLNLLQSVFVIYSDTCYNIGKYIENPDPVSYYYTKKSIKTFEGHYKELFQRT